MRMEVNQTETNCLEKVIVDEGSVRQTGEDDKSTSMDITGVCSGEVDKSSSGSGNVSANEQCSNGADGDVICGSGDVKINGVAMDTEMKSEQQSFEENIVSVPAENTETCVQTTLNNDENIANELPVHEKLNEQNVKIQNDATSIRSDSPAPGENDIFYDAENGDKNNSMKDAPKLLHDDTHNIGDVAIQSEQRSDFENTNLGEKSEMLCKGKEPEDTCEPCDPSQSGTIAEVANIPSLMQNTEQNTDIVLGLTDQNKSDVLSLKTQAQTIVDDYNLIKMDSGELVTSSKECSVTVETNELKQLVKSEMESDINSETVDTCCNPDNNVVNGLNTESMKNGNTEEQVQFRTPKISPDSVSPPQNNQAVSEGENTEPSVALFAQKTPEVPEQSADQQGTKDANSENLREHRSGLESHNSTLDNDDDFKSAESSPVKDQEPAVEAPKSDGNFDFLADALGGLSLQTPLKQKPDNTASDTQVVNSDIVNSSTIADEILAEPLPDNLDDSEIQFSNAVDTPVGDTKEDIVKDIPTESEIVSENVLLKENESEAPVEAEKSVETPIPESIEPPVVEQPTETPVENSEPVHVTVPEENPAPVVAESPLADTIVSEKPTEIPVAQENPVAESQAVEETPESPLPVPKASYEIDWDNFDPNSVNPFATKKSLSNSPPLGRKNPPVEPTVQETSDQPAIENVAVEAPIERAEDKPVETEVKPDVESAETLAEIPAVKESLPETQPPSETPLEVPFVEQTPTEVQVTDEKPVGDSIENSVAEPVIEEKPVDSPVIEEKPAEVPVSEEKAQEVPISENTSVDPTPEERPESPEIPVPKASYDIDWDNFDPESVNPFATKKSIANSPPLGRKNLPAQEPQEPSVETDSQVVNCENNPPEVDKSTQNELIEQRVEVSVTQNDNNEIESETPLVENESDLNASAPAEKCVVGNTDTGAPTVQEIPAEQNTVPVEPESAPIEPEQVPIQTEPVPIEPEQIEATNEPIVENPPVEQTNMEDEEPIPVPKASYNIDWDNFDENINPFETKKAMANSPPLGRKAPIPDGDANPFATKSKIAVTPPSSPKSSHKTADVNENVNNVDANVVENGTSESNNNGITEEPPKASPKKSPAKKKATGPPKKIQSRFKRPPKLANKDNDDIAIFMPGEKPAETKEPESTLAPAVDPSPQNSEPISDSAYSQDSLLSDFAGDGIQSMGDSGVSASSAGDSMLPPSMVPQAAPQQQEEEEDDGFRPAGDVFNDPAVWDMLENCGTKNTESALARQSLYVKFDPLVKGGGNSPAQQPVIPENDGPLPTPTQKLKGDDLIQMQTPPMNNKTSSRLKHPAARVMEDNLLDRSVNNGPHDVFSPAGAAANGLGPDMGENGRGSTTPNSKSADTDSADIIQVLKYSQADMSRMRKEMELDFQAKLLARSKDMTTEQNKIKADRDQLVVTNEQMKTVVAEYERSMAQIIADKENSSQTSKDNLHDLIQERNQALDDLHSVETAFSDLHRRYEKLKGTTEGYKKNEETLKKCISDYQGKLKKQEDRYSALKKHAEEKLELANDEIEKIKRGTETENTRLKAIIKRYEVQIDGFEQTIEQKTKENKELTSICDELLGKAR